MKCMSWTLAVILAMSAPLSAQDLSYSNTQLSGRSFEYAVSDYHLCVSFTGENALTWTYISAPNGETGKSANETLDRKDLTSELILLSWTEASGANVVDVFDFSKMELNASYVTPDGQRFMSSAPIREVASCDGERSRVKAYNTNIKIVEALYSAFNTRDLTVFSEIMAPTLVNYPTHAGSEAGPEAMKRSIAQFLELIPDFSVENVDIITGDGKTVVRSIIRGTPKTSLFGYETNGQSFEVEATDILEIRNGKIQNIWHLENWLKALDQVVSVK